ncbi:hypothetical protein A1O1_04542 [Capronia coronata CBS 617.96]|uniref:BTB domain-containing protein n=1 Tax=Capronia coronata CBS 617.96 TaxID=1182541 RepID=W9YP51_9EURO|nr:uncharacterized protein A1O1_04542 [Capronia coronata CBS 617.96]EXJ91430.1 hypothetical protein A1O1_04542 [Capronia coronata CBS 617.96]
MSTPSASTRASATKGKYSKKTLRITVGVEREPFHVHFSQLERTGFFEVHGWPLGVDALGSPTPASTVRDSTVSPVPVKLEGGGEEMNTKQGLNDHRSLDDLISSHVYHLEGRCYEPAAFEIVVNWLYNQPPETPISRSNCRILLRAYVLALNYQIIPLQDAIVDCIRQYHREFNVVFEDLVWIINRLGDSESLHSIPIVRYLLDQCAWEIYSQGYSSFAHHNTLLEPFLEVGDRPIRKFLFEAITEISRSTAGDPAIGPNRYRVDDSVLFGRTVQGEDNNIIEIDD